MTRFASRAAILAAGFGLALAAAAQAETVTRDHRGDTTKYKTPSGGACPDGRCAPGTVIRNHRGGKTVVRVCGSTGYNTNYCKSHSH